MDKLATRRRELLRPKPFGNDTRFPLISLRKQTALNKSRTLPKPRPKSEYVGTSLIQQDLRRIGNSLELLRINVENEHNEISQEFEKKLLNTSNSICISITDIHQRLDELAFLIGGTFRDSDLFETRSVGNLSQRNTGDINLDPRTPPLLSPISPSPSANQSPEERSFSLHNVGVLTSSPNNSMVSDTRQYLGQRKANSLHQVDEIECLLYGDHGFCVTDYKTSICPSQKSASLLQFEAPTIRQPENPILKLRSCISEEINVYKGDVVMESAINCENSIQSIKSNDSGIDTEEIKDTKMNESRPLRGNNVPDGSYRKWQRNTGNRYLKLKKGYCTWVPESVTKDSGGNHETALLWKSSVHYCEDLNVKTNLLTRYPDKQYPEFFSRKIEDSDEYLDVFDNSSNRCSDKPMSHLLSEKFPGAWEDWRCCISRKMWEGRCLPGTIGEFEKELLKRIETNKSFREDLVHSHNTLRGSHGSPELKEVDDLSRDAQMWADIIADKGFMQYSELPGRGENIAFLETNGKELNGSDVTKLWYGEQSKFDFNDPKWRKETMNFSQMIWKSSTDIGIGVAKLKHQDKCVVVTQYRPIGNGNRTGEFRKNVLPPQ